MEQVKLFIEKAKSDSDLREKLETIFQADADADEIAALAKEAGNDFTVEDWNKYLLQSKEIIAAGGKAELDPDELEGVAGGSPDGNNINCFFEPDASNCYEIRGGEVWLKCKSKCAILLVLYVDRCKCHGYDDLCIGRMHKMEKFTEGVYTPYPRNEHNHSDQRKWVHGLHPGV